MATTELLGRLGNSQDESEFYTPMPEGYRRGHHKYVIVLGTVMSGLGKGIFSSSLAKLLQDKGLRVAPIKMEGYLNIDSGTLNPYRHGEVFVLDDGMETDMDLGTYERMLDQDLNGANFTTNGQILSNVLKKEREGGYLGRDVQVIPHVVGEVKLKLRELAVKSQADVIFVEVGGTVGDYENSFYLEACRQLAYEEGEGSAMFVALTYILEPGALGEQKSKAAQLGIRKLMETGVHPHVIACRAANPVSEKVRQKISMFTNVPMKRVFFDARPDEHLPGARFAPRRRNRPRSADHSGPARPRRPGQGRPRARAVEPLRRPDPAAEGEDGDHRGHWQIRQYPRRVCQHPEGRRALQRAPRRERQSWSGSTPRRSTVATSPSGWRTCTELSSPAVSAAAAQRAKSSASGSPAKTSCRTWASAWASRWP